MEEYAAQRGIEPFSTCRGVVCRQTLVLAVVRQGHAMERK